VYSAGAHLTGRRAAAGALVALAMATSAALGDDAPVQGLGDVLFYAVIGGAPWAAGLAIRLLRQRERSLAVRAADLERDGEERARAAVAEERERIARELHDVVAHGISVMVLQARGGRRALEGDEPQARGAFDAIEQAGSESLTEMRRLLGLLRRADDELALAPQPTLRAVAALAEQVTEAGLPVTLDIEGEVRDLPPGVDLSAYRIVQEALTNALRHAGPASARVRIRYAADDVQLEIADTGRATAATSGGGHGLAGMRERARLYGGEVEADAMRDGGFRVRARLPLHGETG
jgi:signal transduction histidine kinase